MGSSQTSRALKKRSSKLRFQGPRSVSVIAEKRKNAALEFFWIKAERGGVVRVGHDPKLLGPACGVVDHLCVAAGQSFVLFIANQKNWKHARSDRLHRGDFRKRKT